MRFMDYIIEELAAAEDFFYDAYQEVRDWLPPFDLLRYPLYGLYGVFHWLVEFFEDFNEWLDDIDDRVRDILDFGNIWSYFRDWFEFAEDAWNWVRNAWDRVTNIVDDWWLVTSSTVGGWIATATEGLDALRVAWDEFWHITFPTLVSFDWLGIWWESKLLYIQDLISTAIKGFEDLTTGWQEVRDQVLEFFSDPYQWIYDRLDEFFERFW